MTATVRQMLQEKASANVQTVAPDSTVYDALSLMASKDISALLVTEGERLVGIFTERDYARKVILQGRSSSWWACTILKWRVSIITCCNRPESHLPSSMDWMVMTKFH